MARYKYCPDCGARMNMADNPKMFCEKCRRMWGRAKTERRQTSQRSRTTDAFTSSPKWKAFRKTILQRDNFSCQTHYRCGVVLASDSNPVDHIVPRDVDPERAFDASNCQTLCAKCHNRKTYWEQRGLIIDWRYRPHRWVLFGGSQRSLRTFAERESIAIIEVLRDDPTRFGLVVPDAQTAFESARELDARPFELLR